MIKTEKKIDVFFISRILYDRQNYHVLRYLILFVDVDGWLNGWLNEWQIKNCLESKNWRGKVEKKNTTTAQRV